MEHLVFGHQGKRVLAFPTSQGRFYDWEDRGLVWALREPIEKGELQLFCVDSIDSESWYAYYRPAAERVARHDQYDRYLTRELVPFIGRQNETPYLVTVGASFGAYHALNFAFRHPDLVQRVVGMSGLYNIGRFIEGCDDELVYYHNPMAYIANEHEQERLAALRLMDIILAVGKDDSLKENNEELSRLLWGKGIWHALRIWDGFAHDWPIWARMLQMYLSGHD